MFVVAVTGDVGAGKSTLVEVWRSMGAEIVSADEVAKDQWRKPEIMAAMVARWGDEVLTNGAPDFAKIARVVFANEEENRFTRALIHPGTWEEITKIVRSLRGWVVVEIPLLFESGRHDWIDCVVYVTAPKAARSSRNAARGWRAGEVERRERFLLASDEKQALSDVVLTNDGSRDEWEAEARELGTLFAKSSAVYEVMTCCGSLEEAERIGRLLVEKRLAACVNMSAVRSCYRWQGGVSVENEWAISCKTTGSALRKTIDCIKENHSYDLPAITAHDFTHSDFTTLKWIVESCI